MTRGRKSRGRWLLVGLMAVIGLAAGVAVGASRPHVYTSTATVSVGPVNVLSSAQASSNTEGIDLATDYAAIVTTDAVAQLVAKQLHTTAGYVSSHLSATALTDTPLFQVTGQGPTATSARALTAATTSSLASYISGLLSQQQTQPGLLSKYQSASSTSQGLQVRIKRLRAVVATPATTALISHLETQLAVDQLRQQGLASLFLQAGQTQSAGQDATPTVVTAASPGSSSRKKKSAEFGAVGLIAGLCLGLSLIVLLAGIPRPGRVPSRVDDVRLGPV